MRWKLGLTYRRIRPNLTENMFRALFYYCALVPLVLSLVSGSWWRAPLSSGASDDYCVIVKLEKEGNDKVTCEYDCHQVVDIALDETFSSSIVLEGTSSATRRHNSHRHLRGPPV